MNSKRVFKGLLSGLLTAVIVTALTYVGNQIARLPFPPFSLFDFLTRVTPGTIITFFIDLIVGIITSIGAGSTAGTAKLVEQSLAMVQFLVIGALFGGLLAMLRPKENTRRLPMLGLGIGLLMAAAFVGVEAFLRFPSASPALSVGWLIVVLGGWGLGLGWVLRGALSLPAEPQKSEIVAEQDSMQPVGYSRRQVLYLGGTAILALVASALGLGTLLFERNTRRAGAGIPDAGVTPGGSTTSGPAGSPPKEVLEARFEPVPGTRPEITPDGEFYRIDINSQPLELSEEDWNLSIEGLVDNPTTLSLSQIRARPAISQYVTMACISNRIGGDLTSTALWTGTSLKDLLEEVGIKAEAQGLYIESADGFYETVVPEDFMDERTLLVYDMNGQPLPHKHGFPLRIYIPNHYGMKQPKWIVRMEAVADQPPGYWVDRGWSETAIMRTTSVIDVVTITTATDGVTEMGGIAQAGDRGISRVEIQVDEGPWQEAELRDPPLSRLTWVQWRYQGSIPSGDHVAGVRAYDGDGQLQVVEPHKPHPDGATGIHTFEFEV